MAQGFVTEVQRDGCYILENADSTASVRFMFCMMPNPMPASKSKKDDVEKDVVG